MFLVVSDWKAHLWF